MRNFNISVAYGRSSPGIMILDETEHGLETPASAIIENGVLTSIVGHL